MFLKFAEARDETPVREDYVRKSIERVTFTFMSKEFTKELKTESCHKERFQSPGDG